MPWCASCTMSALRYRESDMPAGDKYITLSVRPLPGQHDDSDLERAFPVAKEMR